MSRHDETTIAGQSTSTRRHAMHALGAAGIGAAMALPSRAAPAGPGGPWYYVPPGASISQAIQSGARSIQLGDGTYALYEPLGLPSGCTLTGIGQRTRLVAGARIPAVIAIGNGGAVDGVMVQNMVIDCDNRADIGIDLHIVGTATNYQGEPDSVCRLDNLAVYDALLDGIAYHGTDTQACVTSRVRVRRAARYGFRIESPDNWWLACEATTAQGGASNAGFYVGGANCFFEACKAWYCRGYGFHVKGVRNKFVGCESQDTRSHGWYIEWGMNVYTGCSADSAGATGAGGTPNSADGFYLVTADHTSLTGCQSFDRYGGGAQQRYGFNVPRALVEGGRLIAPTGWGNARDLVLAR